MRQLEFAEQIQGSIHRGGEQQYLAAGTRGGRTSTGPAVGTPEPTQVAVGFTRGQHTHDPPDWLCGLGVPA